MKVAVCISGIPESKHNLQVRNNQVLKEKFPMADFYYATWKGYEDIFYKHFPNDKCFAFQEPVILYHPYTEIKDFTSVYFEETKNWAIKNRKIDWTRHHTKQILIHAMLLNHITENYDIIVRTRFDAFAWKSSEANFIPYIIDSYENKRANCFAVTKKEKFKKLYESDYVKNPKMKEWSLDQLIIHPRNFIDYNHITILDSEKKLRPAEYGWHQILSEPYGNNHRNWHGWVNHDKNIATDFIKEK
jgi:hypothetical protein